MVLDLLEILGGFVFLLLGAEGLVRGASRLASAWGVSALVVGLTVVAAGTSMPELMVSANAALQGKADLSLGNVVGSNIFNTFVILGAAALASPIDIHMQYIRKETPLLIGVTALLGLAAWDGAIDRLEGLLGVVLMLAYTYYAYRSALGEARSVQDEGEDFLGHRAAPTPSVMVNLLLIAGGVAGLVVGGDLLVEGAVGLARALGVSERVIGLTLVAAGTSLPELATSVLATLRGERDIAVANAIGSSVFNILLILGVTATITPLHASPAILRGDLPWALGGAVLLVPLFLTGRRLSRPEGALLLLAYGVYVAVLVTSGAA